MEERKDNPLYDVVVIGAGPAGLTAGLYASRAGLDTLLIEDGLLPSQVSTTAYIENYPGFPKGIAGIELIERFRKQVEGFAVRFITGRVVCLEKVEDVWQVETEKGEQYRAIAVIVATGARPKELGIPGEREFRGRGVSYCAVCDGVFFRGKELIVIGGGDSAVEEALFLTQFARKVTLIHRRNELRALETYKERAKGCEKIGFIWNSQVKRIWGRNTVEGVDLLDVKTGVERKLSTAGVFVFIGVKANTEFVRNIIDLDKNGKIKVDRFTMETSQRGIFACGDCCCGLLAQVITAAADGAVAAFSTQRYVEEWKINVSSSEANSERIAGVAQR